MDEVDLVDEVDMVDELLRKHWKRVGKTIAVVVLMLSASAAVSQEYERRVVVPGLGLSGIHGLGFDAADNLYVGSVIGQSLYRVDVETGEIETAVGPPEGMADDVAFGPDGLMAWTSFTLGTIHVKKGDGPVKAVARGLLGANSIDFHPDGRLFATQVFLGDALYEIDPSGEKGPRKIMEGMGGLNGFEIHSDGYLYGPLWFKGQVAKVNLDTGALEVVAEGFETPAAVNFDEQGRLWVLDTKSGKIYRVDIETGEKTLVSKFKTAMDNLAFDSKDRLFVTVMADNAVYEIDKTSGAPRKIFASALSVPCDLDVYTENGKDMLYVADLFALRSVEGASGVAKDIARNYADELELPINISVNDKHILASSWFSGAVQLFDRETGESLLMAHGFTAPVDAIEQLNGDWLVLETGSRKLVRATGSHKAERTTVVENLYGAVAMASDDGGENVYVTLTRNGEVVRINPSDGTKSTVVRDLDGPEGIAVAPDGTLVVAEVGAQRLLRIDPDNGQQTVIATDLPVGLKGVFGMPASYTPTGVAVSDSGTIYVTSDQENAIYAFSK